MTRYYNYEFSNGHKQFLTPQDARDYSEKYSIQITSNGLESFKNACPSGSHRKRDNQVEGWNPGIGKYIKSKTHYKELLKEAGLEEIGNEKLPPLQDKKIPLFSEEIVKGAIDMGANLSGNEIRMMEST